ncbi:MAG: flagellar export protein FliJ [Methylophilaceae bacterium]
MASSSAVKMLFDLASEEADLAAKHLAVANKALKEAKEKGEMLQGYKQDYIENFNQQMKNGLGKEGHHNYQSFLQNLQQVINGQEDVIVSAQYESDKKREVLQTAQRKKMSYEVLIKRAEKKAMMLANKRDQKMMDEFAMRTQRTRSKTSIN